MFLYSGQVEREIEEGLLHVRSIYRTIRLLF